MNSVRLRAGIMGNCAGDDMFNLTKTEFEDFYTGYRLSKLNEKEDRADLSRMIRFANNAKKQDWVNYHGDISHQRIYTLGGADELDSMQVNEAKVNQRLTELVNKKSTSNSMDSMELAYLKNHGSEMERKE